MIEKFAKDLRRLSSRHDCSVLAINQFTKRMRPNPEASDKEETFQFHYVPFLGQTWRNNVDTSIVLTGEESKGR